MEPQRPRLTIGMATHSDFDGVYFTLQALRLYQDAETMRSVEVVVVDNAPQTSDGQALFTRDARGNHGGFLISAGQGGPDACGLANIKYVPFTQRNSTSATRQAIIDNAEAPIVLVVDCHILLDPGSVKQLIEHLEADTDSPAIYNGPLRHDNLAADQIETHFNETWGGGMWGQWGRAWRCCRDGVLFSVTPRRRQPGRISATGRTVAAA